MDECADIMLTPDSPARIDIAVDLGMPIVARGGLLALTPATLAREVGCSRQAVAQWCGAQQELRVAFAARFTARWGRWATLRVRDLGPIGLLPSGEQSLAWSRIWQAILEQASREVAVAALVAAHRRVEGEALAHHVELEVWRERTVALSALPLTVAPLHVLAEGLRARVTLDGLGEGLGWAQDIVTSAAEELARDLVPGLA